VYRWASVCLNIGFGFNNTRHQLDSTVLGNWYADGVWLAAVLDSTRIVAVGSNNKELEQREYGLVVHHGSARCLGKYHRRATR